MTIAHPTTIGLRAAPLDLWLTRGEDDERVLDLRAKLIAEKPEAVLGYIPESKNAVSELGHLLAARDGWTCPETALDTLKVLGRTYVEDICVLIGRDHAPYILGAAVLCFPNRWNLSEKIGKPMLSVHAPVPDYAEKLSAQVDFFLDRLRPGRCFKRMNWGVVGVDTLHLPDPTPPVNIIEDQDFYVRMEGQSFLKLPATGAIVFTIHTALMPWRNVNPDDRSAILEHARTLGPEWLAYKSIMPAPSAS